MTITLEQLFIYPVKSLGGIELKSARILPRGLEYDRRFMVVTREGDFLTQREHPRMATVWVEIEGDRLLLAAPDQAEVTVPLEPPPAALRDVRIFQATVSAHEVSDEANEFLSIYLGRDCQLVYMPESSRRGVPPGFAPETTIVSFADGFPMLVTTIESLADLNARIVANGGAAVPMSRFRPNLVLSGAPGFAEDHWQRLRIGECELHLAKPSARCQITTTDQATGTVVGPEPLATLSRFRPGPSGPKFGHNAVGLALGELRVGMTGVADSQAPAVR